MSQPPKMNKPILYSLYVWQLAVTAFLAYSVFVPTAPEGIENIAMFGVYSVILFQLFGCVVFSIVLMLTGVLFSDPTVKENYIGEQLKAEKPSVFMRYLLNLSSLIAIGLLIWTGSLFTAGLFTFFFLVNALLIAIHKYIMKKATDEFISSAVDTIAVEVLAEVVD